MVAISSLALSCAFAEEAGGVEVEVGTDDAENQDRVHHVEDPAHVRQAKSESSCLV